MDPITVGTADLRAALQAVIPHAGIPKDAVTHRVRLTFNRVNVTASATNRYTVGHALISVEEHGDDLIDGTSVDLTPTDAKEVVAIFKGEPGDDEMPGDLLTLTVSGRELVITDVSGLFPGKSLTIPSYGVSEGFPDIPKLLAGMLRRTRSDVDRMPFDGAKLAFFAAAAKAYDKALVLEPTGDQTALLIACGDSFLGGIMPLRLGEDAAVDVKTSREAWVTRLPAAAKDTPVDLVVVMEAAAEKINSGALDKDGITVTATVKRGQRPEA